MTILRIKDENGNFIGIPTVKGEPGEDGVGIASISYNETSISGGNNQLTILLTNGKSYECLIKNGNDGPQGIQGKEGNGITDISYYESQESGGNNQLNINTSDGKIYNFYIKNGKKGENGKEGKQGIQGVPGYTPVKGKDYFTEQDIKDLNIPRKTSQLQNDSGFLTKHQDLSDYAKKTDIPDVSNFITKEVSNLTNYYDKNKIDELIGDVETLLSEV